MTKTFFRRGPGFRAGFSLFELLIAIIVLGILAGIAMPVMMPSRDKAEATRIVSDLKTLARAAHMAHADRGSWPTQIEELGPYLDGKLCEASRVCFELASLDDVLYVRGNLGEKITSGVRERVARVAGEYGIYELREETLPGYTDADSLYYRLGASAWDGLVSAEYLLSVGFDEPEDLAFFINLYPRSKEWILADGSLTTPETGASERYAFGDRDWQDYSITANVTLESGNGYGIYYRADGQQDITGYIFQYDPGLGDKFVVRKVVEGREQSPFEEVKMTDVMGSDFGVKGTSHEVTIEVVGDRHVISVDGVEVLDFTDGDFTEGSGGLRKWGAGVTVFEEIRVKQL